MQNSRQGGRTSTFACAGTTCNPTPGTFGLDAPVSARMEQRLEWFGTLRGRLGVTPTAGSLFYATGGLAVAASRPPAPSAARASVSSRVSRRASKPASTTTAIRSKSQLKPDPHRRREPDHHHLLQSADQGGLDRGRRRRGSARGQLDRQDRVPLSRLRHGLDHRNAPAERDAARGHVQFPRHGKSRAARRQLQVRSTRGGVRPTETAIGLLVFKAPVRSAWSWPASISAAPSATAGARPIPASCSATLPARASSCDRAREPAPRRCDRRRTGRLQLGRGQSSSPASRPT